MTSTGRCQPNKDLENENPRPAPPPLRHHRPRPPRRAHRAVDSMARRHPVLLQRRATRGRGGHVDTAQRRLDSAAGARRGDSLQAAFPCVAHRHFRMDFQRRRCQRVRVAPAVGNRRHRHGDDGLPLGQARTEQALCPHHGTGYGHLVRGVPRRRGLPCRHGAHRRHGRRHIHPL